MSLFPEMHFRADVDLRNMSPQILFAWQCASVVCHENGIKCEATNVYQPGVFSIFGFHSNGNAIDIGMRNVPLDVGDVVHARLDSWLGRKGGGQYDVINELRPGTSKRWSGPHIHIEFDPK